MPEPDFGQKPLATLDTPCEGVAGLTKLPGSWQPAELDAAIFRFTCRANYTRLAVR